MIFKANHNCNQNKIYCSISTYQICTKKEHTQHTNIPFTEE